jgi:YopX protein
MSRSIYEFEFRAWDGKKIIHGIIPWRWDFVLSNNIHTCTYSEGSGILGSGGKFAKFELHGYSYQEDTIMQFTGFLDMKGKKIYEGDIVESPYTGQKVVVEWDKNYAQFTFGGAEFNVEVRPGNLEILGNIYEHPELVKSEQGDIAI